MVTPYEDLATHTACWQRTFDQHVPDAELVWHRDHQTRHIQIMSGTGWCLQLDNQMPQPLIVGDHHVIPAGMYHRIIKGDQDLVVLITEDRGS